MNQNNGLPSPENMSFEHTPLLSAIPAAHDAIQPWLSAASCSSLSTHSSPLPPPP